MVMNGTDPQTVATFHNQTDNQVAYADRRTVAKAIARYLLVTDSYTRRDVVSPVLRGEAPRPRIPLRRLRALGGYAARTGRGRPSG
jgi:hypothetical protein